MVMKIKGYKPTKKCATYIKKMISQGTWPINERIPTIKKLTETLDVSSSTVRNTLLSFEREGILENYGSLGFFLKSKEVLNSKTNSLSLIKKAKLNLEATTMIRSGATRIYHWIVHFDKQSRMLTALNIVAGTKISCLYDIISDIIKNPITPSSLLKTSNAKEYKIKRAQYDRQLRLLPLAKLILHYNKEIITP
jgi:DNA-binding transcriptional regulator YhcF (GntR family)